MNINRTVISGEEPSTDDYLGECETSHGEEPSCICLSNLSSSAVVYVNFAMSSLVFCNSNPYLRRIRLSSACMMVSAFVQLMRASYTCGRICDAVLCSHLGDQSPDPIFTLIEVKEQIILRSLKPQKSPAVQTERSVLFLIGVLQRERGFSGRRAFRSPLSIGFVSSQRCDVDLVCLM